MTENNAKNQQNINAKHKCKKYKYIDTKQWKNITDTYKQQYVIH